MISKEWFKQTKYGMMIHWGLCSFTSGDKGEVLFETPATLNCTRGCKSSREGGSRLK